MANGQPESVLDVQMNGNSKKSTVENAEGTRRAKGATAKDRQTHSLSPVHSTHITVSILGV